MTIIELTDYALLPEGNGNGLRECFFTLAGKDVCSIEADILIDARCLLRALATITPPAAGSYCYRGKRLDFSDYRHLLTWKKKIGYISQDSAMISNLTIRENLLLMRYYFENSLSVTLDENTSNLCRSFKLEDKLDLRPGALDPLDLQAAIMIRELTKAPEVLLMDRPEDFVGHAKFIKFISMLKTLMAYGVPIVTISDNKEFIETFVNKKIIIAEGKLTTIEGI